MDCGSLAASFQFRVSSFRKSNTHSGNHLVTAAGQLAEHAVGVGCIAGFAQDLIVNYDDSVGTENDLSWVSFRDNFYFFLSQALGVLSRRFAAFRILRDIGHVDGEWNTGAVQKLGAARRC